MKKSDISFEAAMAELETILEKMSTSDITLDESIELYARSADLFSICNKKLNSATVKVQEINEKIAAMENGDDI